MICPFGESRARHALAQTTFLHKCLCPLGLGFNRPSHRSKLKGQLFPRPRQAVTGTARQLNEQRGGLRATARTPLRSNTSDKRRAGIQAVQTQRPFSTAIGVCHERYKLNAIHQQDAAPKAQKNQRRVFWNFVMMRDSSGIILWVLAPATGWAAWTRLERVFRKRFGESAELLGKLGILGAAHFSAGSSNSNWRGRKPASNAFSGGRSSPAIVRSNTALSATNSSAKSGAGC